MKTTKKGKQTGKKPELLLPAASMDTLKAAVLNGADAVYFGAKKFNARMPAGNFSKEEMQDAIDFCHLHGKKAYLTLNTLLKDNEIWEAVEIAKDAYCAGIDAAIVQDLGLIKALRELLPGLELHASTQMTCHNSAGAEFLKNLGMKRIILARELSLSEVKEIKKNSGAEVECFVHGALCFSYSGQCLFSSFVFNKSGNRGMCLQPCRLAYTLTPKGTENRSEGEHEVRASAMQSMAPVPATWSKSSKCALEPSSSCAGRVGGFVLSMKDMVTARQISELIEAGIDAFKIEGRLKGVEYVAATAKAYRIAIDACFGSERRLTEDDINLMKIAFMREHGTGYFLGQRELVHPESPARKGVAAAKVLGFKGQRIRLMLYQNLSQWDRLSAIGSDNVEEFSASRIYKTGKEINRAFKGQIVDIETGMKPYLAKEQMLYFTSSQRLRNFAYSSIKRGAPREYDLNVSVHAGEQMRATAKIGERKVGIVSEFIPEKSRTAQTTENMLKGKLLKANDFFAPRSFTCEIAGSPFVPLSELKKFKNRILAEMRNALFAGHRRGIDEKKFSAKAKELKELMARGTNPAEKTPKQEVAVFISDANAKPEPLLKNADIIVCYDSMPKSEIDALAKKFPEKKVYVKASNIQPDEELEEFRKKFIRQDAGIVCSNLGALQLAAKGKARFWAGSELNAFNSLAAKMLIDFGAERIVPSVECSLRQLNGFAQREKLVPLVFFYPVLMTSKAYAKTGLKGEYTLKDRKGFNYRAVIDGKGIIRIYNPLPVDMLFEIEKFGGFSAIGLDFSAASSEEAKDAAGFLHEKLLGKMPKKKFAKFTRGHYDRELF